MNMELLPLIWAAILGLSVTLYVLLDGFSLGAGILFPFAKTEQRRDMIMASVAPVWDGNQTWLVGGGMALLTAFPKAFNLLLSTFYLPLSIMLLALVFRGVAFEFRFKAKQKTFWDRSFIGGSTVAAFCQGLVLGGYIQGFDLVTHANGAESLALHAGSVFSPFAIATGIAVCLAYALLGACWLIVKTEGAEQAWARRAAKRLVPLIGVAVLMVSLWTPYVEAPIAERWFTMPNLLFLSPVPIWTVALFGTLLWSLRQEQRWDGLPFLSCIGLYLLTLVGLAISVWPWIVPRVFSIWDIAAPEPSLMFALVGVLFIVPVILVYTAHAYYVFRGKTDIHDVYH
jgi:cytochrome d ubiquinol oxidase subunit II